jgi:hypothetical protein
LSAGVHLVQHDGVRTVAVLERPEGGIQIRFTFLGNPLDVQMLEVDRGSVRIRIADGPTP